MHLSWSEIWDKSPALHIAAAKGKPVTGGYSDWSPDVLQTVGKAETAEEQRYYVASSLKEFEDKEDRLHSEVGQHTEGCPCFIEGVKAGKGCRCHKC